MTGILVRPARHADCAGIAAVYNEGIRERIATFETRERGGDEITAWLDDPSHPVLVAVEGCAVVGFVAAFHYRPRECYSGIAEFSVYVARATRGRGVGRQLMEAFLPACERAGLWKLVSRVFPENSPSRALLARHGFREVGTYRRHAKLDGEWRDVVIIERLLGAALE